MKILSLLITAWTKKINKRYAQGLLVNTACILIILIYGLTHRSHATLQSPQTYAIVQEKISANMEGITHYKEGWDDKGKVAWKPYYNTSTKTWRMLFADDERSLGYKYDFAKEKNLGGVGIWALGFDDRNNELWDQLAKTFGSKKYADTSLPTN